MPILPENRSRYPANWHTEIRPRILERAGHRCEFEGCGVANYAIGYRDKAGSFIETQCPMIAHAARLRGEKIIKIILTIAHMDHVPEHCSDDNLKAACQRCHNRYDAEYRKQNRASRRAVQKEG